MTAANPSSVCSTVLHILRCIGAAGAERVSAASAIAHGEAEDCLRELEKAGLAMLSPGPFGGWSVTDAGRRADDEWLALELDVLDARERVLTGYDRFLGLNPALLQVCSDWQMRRIGNTPILNDHKDEDYDSGVLSRLIRLDDSAREMCGELAEALERFAVYRTMLSSALERAMAGSHGHVADTFDSYHMAWFQLHEDLLLTLGMSREEERRNLER